MARIDDILYSLHGAKWFTKLDLFSGFFQIEIDDCCKPKTAFMTFNGLYEYNYMSFGMCNAPAVFNRVMRMALAPVLNKMALCYMDDILIFGSTFQIMLQHLKEVLRLLNQHGLTLKPSKCFFGKTEVDLLGHTVSAHGISCSKDKLNAIATLLPPNRRKDVRSFLGATGYYRNFIPNYASITAPLRGLLKKYTPFTWTDDCQRSFDALKEAILSPPILVHFDPQIEKIITTDASLSGIGGALLQPYDGINKPVAYTSRSLKDAEKNYSATELECLAVVHCVMKFREYIFEQPFTIVVDHHALCALTSCKQPLNARLSRWQLLLQGLNMTIKYTKGATHHLPDCLSRLPTLLPTIADEDFLEIPMLPVAIDVTKDTDLFKEAQQADDFIDSLMASKPLPKPFVTCNGLLYWTTTSGKRLLVVPSSLETDLIAHFHDSPLAGHLGVEKTIQRVRNGFYLPFLAKKVNQYVKSCLTCQMRKGPNQKPYGFTQTIDTTKLAPMDLVSMDCIGPLPKTKTGMQHIVIGVDYSTRFVFGRAIRTLSSKSLLSFLLQDVISKFGLPRKLLTGNATVFTSDLFQSVSKALGMAKLFSTPYHSQGNTLCERQNRTIEDMLSKYVNENHTDWDTYLPMVIFAINSSVHTTMTSSPFFLMFRRDAQLPLDVQYPTIVSDSGPQACSQARYREVYRDTTKRLKAELARQRGISDHNRTPLTFEVGDLVMVRLPQLTPGLSRKLTMPWKGPFEVLKATSPATYIVIPCFMGKRRRRNLKTHVSNMKPYVKPPTRPLNKEDDSIISEPLQTESLDSHRTDGATRSRSGRLIKPPERLTY